MTEKIQFFPLDAAYKVVDGKAVINLYGRTADGKQICVLDSSFEPYFYVIPKDSSNISEKLAKIRVQNEGEVSFVAKAETVSKRFLGKDVVAIKAYTNLPSSVPVIAGIAREWESVSSIHEFDIPFVRRYFIDKGIIPLTLHQATGEFVNQKSRVAVFRADIIEQSGSDTLHNPKILAFDIETYSPFDLAIDAEKNPIIMLSFYGEGLKKVFVWKKFKTDIVHVEFVGSEAELIEKFKETVENFKPDILTGYFSDGFDLPYIKTRAEKHKIKLDIGCDFSELKVKSGRETIVAINGITHLDIFKFIKKVMGTTLETYTYDLNSVAAELLEEKKHDVSLAELSDAWDNNHQELGKFCDYCAHDSVLTYNLAVKMLPIIIEMVKIVGIPIYDVNRMGFSQLVEWYIMKQAPQFNEIAPNKPVHDEVMRRRMNTYQGAFVYEPKPGLYHDIAVFDFRSLYPTILSSHNIGTDSIDCACCEDTAKITPGENERHWFCAKRKGFIPILIEDLITRRMRIKEIIKEEQRTASERIARPQVPEKFTFLDARQNSLKLLANSFYGYLGFFGARWYSIECARCVTAWGRHYIHKVIDKAQKEGFLVLYSDTDSVFLTLDNRPKDVAKNFAESVNLELPGLMELEYQGFYPSGIFVSAKLALSGAKKKYALLSEEGTLNIKGFETVRRNWSFIAKDVQENVLGIILRESNTEKALDYVKNVINDLKNKRIPIKSVVIHTQLQKDILDYAAKGPHVAVAQRLKNKGRAIGPGSMIKYVVTQGNDMIRNRSKLPEEVKENEYDADYYINNQVIPAVERIFNVLGFKKEDLLETKEQTKLEGFF
ncbi:ribonuclease H-like domain-containing protein [Candidatus Woesearchaeota archaeon]|nr:ribonuclease H-like domain-containing protein [Candidatus Woesearchaeota archaeon]